MKITNSTLAILAASTISAMTTNQTDSSTYSATTLMTSVRTIQGSQGANFVLEEAVRLPMPTKNTTITPLIPMPVPTRTIKNPPTHTMTPPPHKTFEAPGCVALPRYIFFTGWRIRAYNIPNVPEVCGRMWYQLRQFEPECRWLFKAHCEELAPAVLDLKFAVGAHCNRGMIQSAWWEATQNTYGALHCRKWEEIYPQERREWMIFD